MLPNFLIVGAAKAGTTAVTKLLELSDEVCFPSKKEPRFLIKQHIQNISDEDPLKDYLLKDSILTFEDYNGLYINCESKFRGDASVHSLFNYKESIKEIKNYLGDIKIIIILRDPIDRLYSNYKYLKKIHGHSLEKELSLESYRIKNNWNSFWHYKAQGLYYKSVKAFKESFSEVLILRYEDFSEHPNDTINEILDFLGGSRIKITEKQYSRNFNPNYDYTIIGRILINVLPNNVLKSDNRFFREARKKIMPFLQKRLTNDNRDIEVLKELREYYADDIRNLNNYYSIKLC